MGNKKVRTVSEIDVLEEVLDGKVAAELLKVDHTHGGIFYKKGTPIDELNAHPSSVKYMREHGVL